MNENEGIMIVAIIVLFGFLAFLVPELLNNAYALGSTHYAAPLVAIMVFATVGAVIYFLAKVADIG